MFFKLLLRFMGGWVTPPLPNDHRVEPQLPSDLPPMKAQPVSSSPSSSSFTHDSSWTYDVFLSFRGKDTRTNFVDHLYKALSDKGIYTFIDRELVRGEEISPALVKAIEESRISLIVFSESYASSRWCLDELVKILQCKQSNQQIVLPIFYKLDPSHVRNQTSKFGDAFIESKFKDNEKVLIWKEALRQAANLSGDTFKDGQYETTFIDNIVDGILSQVLSRTYLPVANYPVGIQSRVQDVKKLLDVCGNGRRMVGIWGTSGIGKTTIAKAIWNEIAHKFEGSCFLENVRENSMPHGGLIELQKTLLHKILGRKLEIHSVAEGIGFIKERLRRKKILLILDDVDKLEQLDNLAGDDWFGEGSRIICTTKDTGLLENRGIELIYKVKKLDDYQALELFSWHAFQRSEPPKDYLELAPRAIAFADGLPLALTILGSHLRNRDIRRWQVILDDYKGEPYTHIERILQKSYDALDDYAKEAFLDIACFFNGEENCALQIVPKNCIEVLLDKAMITIKLDSRILMHDLLANLGKDIVRKESPNDPGQRSRLWFYEDVKQVLTESTGTRNIKGIMVKLPKPAEITLNPECFRNMVNLEIFINRNASLCRHINYLPNALRLIDWGGCQLQSLPANFQGNRLVVFNMPGSHIRLLEGFKHWPNLKSMNLSGCQFLKKIPDLSGIPNIEYLNLSGCRRLVEVDDSVGFLARLAKLYLSYCFQLTRFGTALRLKSLEVLYLRHCKKLESFPEIEVEMESLRILVISGSGVRELPPSIAYLTGLTFLDLTGCFNLTRFGRALRLKSLNKIKLSDCKRLESFPEIEVQMESQWTLDISGSGVRELPYNFDNRTITEQVRPNPNKSKFTLAGCSLSKIDFPLPLHCWSTLTELDLSGNNFVNLPTCFSKFVNLCRLDLSDCKSLLEVPEQVLPRRVSFVFLDNCTSLEKIPKVAWVLLDNCTPLEAVDDSDRTYLSLMNCVRTYLSLMNCVRQRGYDITENIFRNHLSVTPVGDFQIFVPGDEVPKWFSCRGEYWYNGNKHALCEVKFKIPPNLKWETLGLVLCVATETWLNNIFVHIRVDGKLVNFIFSREMVKSCERKGSHVWLVCFPLLDRHMLREPLKATMYKQSKMCQVRFEMLTPVKLLSPVKMPSPVKMTCGVHLLGHQIADVRETNVKMTCGVHLLGHQVADVRETDVVDHGPTQWLLPDAMAVDDDIHDDQHQYNELVSLPSASETSLGKRPRLSDFMALDHRANVVDVGDHEAQRGEANHPKRRHVDRNEEPKQ